MIKVIITGAKGRMGRTLIECAGRNPALQVAAQIDMGDDLRQVIDQGDVVIDFSFHEVTAHFTGICVERKKPIVIGTTGHSDSEGEFIRGSRADIPIVWASNYSTGVNMLFWLTRKAAEILGRDYDLEVVEMHHRMKRDAPSGTARSLGEILAAARGERLDDVARPGRSGITGERSAAEIGLHSLRGGDVVGDHTVIFAGLGERLELTHRASSRETFANGALRAAEWAVNQKPGLYTMEDVLGLEG